MLTSSSIRQKITLTETSGMIRREHVCYHIISSCNTPTFCLQRKQSF